VTIEFGSLYADEANAPPADGSTKVVLCEIEVDGDANVCVTVNATRGGVVLTDGTSVTPDLSLACALISAGCACWGDADADMDNDAPDYTTLLMHLYFNGGNSTNGWTANNPIPFDRLCLDINGDGVLDAPDYTALLMHLYFNGGNSTNGWTADYCKPVP